MRTLSVAVIGSPRDQALSEAVIREIISSLPRQPPESNRVRPDWLRAQNACVYPNFVENHQAERDVREEIASSPTLARLKSEHHFDIVVLSGSPQARKLLVADMESTIIEQEMLDELGDFIGARARIEEITARAMRGELDFEAALDERVGLLKGLDAGVLDEVAKRITLMAGAETLVATMKANGAYCALVSGGFTVFTSRVAKQLGFDEHRANTLEIADGKLTGRVIRPILGREAKLAALQELTAKLGLQPSQTLAVGDGANDLAMLGAAGLGVAFRAKPKVREAAAAMPNGAVITHGDLTALLALQGYGETEHVTA